MDSNISQRPKRHFRAPADSPFVDSAIAVSGDEDSEYEEGSDSAIAVSDEEDSEDDEETVLPPNPRKRKRSSSPSLSPPDETTELTDCDDEIPHNAASDSEEVSRPSPANKQITIQNLTINLPKDHTGPVLLQIDTSASQITRSAGPKKSLQLAKSLPPPRMPMSKRQRTQAAAKPTTKSKYAGFLDLPAELRNEIYRHIFVPSGRFDFGRPTNFSRSAALLRTCSQVHNEARTILYGENEFHLQRRTSRYGSFWESEWRELGFRNVRHFVKSIGPTNTALLRHVSFQFEDATPCLNPPSMTHEERRFVNDDVLMSILRHLGDYAQLEQLDINFHGRRRVEASDERFLGYLKRIKTDRLRWFKHPIDMQTQGAQESKQAHSVGQMLMKTMVRKEKLYD